MTRRFSRTLLSCALGLSLGMGPAVLFAAEEAKPAEAGPAADAKPVADAKPAADAGPAVDAKPAAAKAPATKPSTRPVAKAISDNVKKGLDWLAKSQNKDGGWDQGEINKDQIRGGEAPGSNIADTCMAALAFVRCGHTPSVGDHAKVVQNALDFVCTHVEKASQEGLSITDIRTTRLQTKLGPQIDTFAAALLLAEVRDKMPDEASRKRVIAALDKVMDKIEKNQKEDGRWVDAGEGWAAILCNSVATKAVFRAAQNGAQVDDQVLTKAQKFAAQSFDSKSGAVKGDGSAGIELYARSANLQAFSDADQANASRAVAISGKLEDAQKRADEAKTQLAQIAAAGPQATTPAATRPAEQQLAQAQQEIVAANAALGEIRENTENLKVAQTAAIERMTDARFVAGFGNNGGEEFLSYMNIGESLVQKGGDEFGKWDKAMTDNLNRIQNPDGSWSGHHCITGRTFCTSAALLTLTVDRTGEPMAAKVK